ncbi:MAG TPA: hypothetical protein DIU39_05035 [Flavobacteriales bacterium]|nr:hypothetical protein [Flavobacteriales bacterium]|tara:strand:+ start:319 stop:531 length:213 start_codon:yes stop_codon:yes gene_type:complete
MLKWIKFLEKMWLMLAILSATIAIYKLFASTVDDAGFFFIFSAMATILYFLRKRQAKTLAKSMEEKPKKK